MACFTRTAAARRAIPHGRLAAFLKHKGGCTAVLDAGYSFGGSRVIRADSLEELREKAKAAERCDWWVTMNGSHVLIKGNEIVGGAGGKLNGKRYGYHFSEKEKSNWIRPGAAGIAPLSEKERAERAKEPYCDRYTLKSLDGPLTITKKDGSASEIPAGLKNAGLFSGLGSIDAGSMKGLSKSLMTETANRLLELEHKFGASVMLSGLGRDLKIEAVTPEDGEGYVAQVGIYGDMGGAFLRLNKANYKSAAKHAADVKDGAERGYLMPCDPKKYREYIVTHEYGHMLQDALFARELKKRGLDTEEKRWQWAMKSKDGNSGMADAVQETFYRTQGRCIREIAAIAKRKDPSFRLEDHLSTYGKTNYAEAFAELFANSQCGAPTAAGEAMSIWLKEKGLARE